MAVTRPALVYKSLIPIIMAGILGIYGLIVAVILYGKIPPANEIMVSSVWGCYSGLKGFAAGLCTGGSSVAAGYAIGVAGDAAVRCYGMNQQIFVGMILILIFGEAIGLYGLIIAIIMSNLAVQG